MSFVARCALVTTLVLAAFAVATPTLGSSMAPILHRVGIPAAPPAPAPAAEYAEAMVAAAEDAAPSRMTLGTAVLDLATGELAVRGTDEFYSASLSKLMLVVDMLDRDVDLSDADLGLVDRALSLSDDNAMNALWVRFDGPAAMTRVAETLGMPNTGTPDDPSQWGETEVSPAGFARLYQHILTEMNPADRTLIVNALSAAQPEAADGFDQFFGLLGQPTPAYAKQGWMYYGANLYLHSAGVVHTPTRDLIVILMSIQPAASSAPAAVTAVASAMLGVVAENV